MKIHNVKQGSSEWLFLRAGKLTCSELDSLISPEWKVRTGQGPETYCIEKVTEKLIGQPLDLEQLGSFAMTQGNLLEAEAIPWLAFTQNIKVDRVGFITTDDESMGCSPDGLIGEDGGLEVKCPLAQTHIRYLLDGQVPKQYLAQVHGSMYVTRRKWWLFMSYSRQFPKLIVRVERDESIQAKIHAAVEAFKESFTEKLNRINELKSRE